MNWIQKITLILISSTLLISCNENRNEKRNGAQKKEIISKEAKDYSSQDQELSNGGVLYVPIYASFNKDLDFHSILSVRNTSIKKSIQIVNIDIYDNDGNLIKEVTTDPVDLKNLASFQYKLKIKENYAEIGGNYIVEWKSDSMVSKPVVEVVHYYVQGTLGMSFITPSVESH